MSKQGEIEAGSESEVAPSDYYKETYDPHLLVQAAGDEACG